MSAICDNCHKGRQRGHRVSHAKNRSIHFFQPNLHSVRVMEAGKVVRKTLCSRCLKKAERPSRAKSSPKSNS